jgi:ADP-heptose:LPS heptosyltransferase
MDTQILVIHPGSLGDVVLSLPALGALKQAYPMAGLDLIGNPSVLELVRGRFYADRVISIDRADVTFCLAGLEDFAGPWVDTLRGYSLIVNWLGEKDEGFSRYVQRIGVQRIVSSRPISRKTTQQHRINIFLESLLSLKIPTPFSLPQIFPPPEDRKLGREALLCSGIDIQERPVLAIHPGSGGRYKCWDFERFIEVSHQAQEHLGFQPLFILGPAEGGLAQKLKSSLGRDVAVLDSVPLPILAGALAGCDSYLGNDSGVTHLAAALGIPTVAIFGPTDPRLWGPVGQHVRVLSKRMEGGYERQNICQGCGCLDLVSVEEVIHVLSETALDYSETI